MIVVKAHKLDLLLINYPNFALKFCSAFFDLLHIISLQMIIRNKKIEKYSLFHCACHHGGLEKKRKKIFPICYRKSYLAIVQRENLPCKCSIDQNSSSGKAHKPKIYRKRNTIIDKVKYLLK